MIERLGEAAHDRQAEPEAAVDGAAAAFALELLEDRLAAAGRNAGAGVADLDANAVAAAARAEQHAAAPRVAQRVGDEVLQDALQQQGVGADIGAARPDRQLEAAGGGDRREFLAQRRKNLFEFDDGEVRPHRAGVELRHVEQGANEVFEAGQGEVDLASEAADLVVGRGLGQRRQVEPRGVERLQEIVADEGEERRLEGVGLLGELFGLEQRLVGAFDRTQGRLQFRGAPAHRLVERDRHLEQPESVVGLIHRALDARHQRRVDLLQLDVFLTQTLNLIVHRARLPMATPENVWLRCMVSNCSP